MIQKAGGGQGGSGIPNVIDWVVWVGDKSQGISFRAKIDVLESMGSEFYAYIVL